MLAVLRIGLWVGLVALGLLAGPGAASAEEWGNITPGVSTTEQVRAVFGAPSKETRAKVEGYDTMTWTFEEGRAPGGIQRMTIEYGLLTPQGYKPTVVRLLRLEPKPKVFGMSTVVQAWGVPDNISRQGEQEAYYYRSGLIVLFDKAGTDSVSLSFTPPQPDKPTR